MDALRGLKQFRARCGQWFRFRTAAGPLPGSCAYGIDADDGEEPECPCRRALEVVLFELMDEVVGSAPPYDEWPGSLPRLHAALLLRFFELHGEPGPGAPPGASHPQFGWMLRVGRARQASFVLDRLGPWLGPTTADARTAWWAGHKPRFHGGGKYYAATAFPVHHDGPRLPAWEHYQNQRLSAVANKARQLAACQWTRLWQAAQIPFAVAGSTQCDTWSDVHIARELRARCASRGLLSGDGVLQPQIPGECRPWMCHRDDDIWNSAWLDYEIACHRFTVRDEANDTAMQRALLRRAFTCACVWAGYGGVCSEDDGGLDRVGDGSPFVCALVTGTLCPSATQLQLLCAVGCDRGEYMQLVLLFL